MNDAETKDEVGEPASGPEPRVASPSGTPPMDIQAYIGTRLREVYNDVASQPIPDRFLDLMRQLDAK